LDEVEQNIVLYQGRAEQLFDEPAGPGPNYKTEVIRVIDLQWTGCLDEKKKH